MLERERFYQHRTGAAVVQESEQNALISLWLIADVQEDEHSDQFLSHFAAFPAIVGNAGTRKGAVVKLRKGFKDYVDAYLELNGLEAFVRHLQEAGFEETEIPRIEEPWEGIPAWVVPNLILSPRNSHS